ncbi:hypothetical protein MHYP_G00262300 [Metynnis hypsauchen]
MFTEQSHCIVPHTVSNLQQHTALRLLISHSNVVLWLTVSYFYTAVTPGINFQEFTVVGLLDGVEFVYYDSNIRKMIPKTEWIEKSEGEDYWTRETQKAQGNQESFKVSVGTLMQRFNQTGVFEEESLSNISKRPMP